MEERFYGGDFQGAEGVVFVYEGGEDGGVVGPEIVVGRVWVCEFEESAWGIRCCRFFFFPFPFCCCCCCRVGGGKKQSPVKSVGFAAVEEEDVEGVWF